MKDGLAALASVGRATGLGDKVVDDVVERAKVVLVGLAEFDKVEREDRAQLGFEVDLPSGFVWEVSLAVSIRVLLLGLRTMMSPTEVSKRTDWRVRGGATSQRGSDGTKRDATSSPWEAARI